MARDVILNIPSYLGCQIRILKVFIVVEVQRLASRLRQKIKPLMTVSDGQYFNRLWRGHAVENSVEKIQLLSFISYIKMPDADSAIYRNVLTLSCPTSHILHRPLESGSLYTHTGFFWPHNWYLIVPTKHWARKYEQTKAKLYIPVKSETDHRSCDSSLPKNGLRLP